MAFRIREHVPNPDDPEYEEMYDTIDNLVNVAGHITIAELFMKPFDEVPDEVLQVIQKAGRVGIFGLGNKWCCDFETWECVRTGEPDDFCLMTSSGKCALSSVRCS